MATRRRKNGTGNIRLRKDGRWEGRIVIGYKDDGKSIIKNALAKTQAEVRKKLDKLIEDNPIRSTSKFNCNSKFGEWLKFWYENFDKPTTRGNTQQWFEYCIESHIIPHLGTVKLCDLTQMTIQKFYTEIKTNGRIKGRTDTNTGLSDRTVRACHATCRLALEKAKEEKLIKENPAIGCKLPPKKPREMQVLTKEEITAFLMEAKRQGYFELFLLDLMTGMRRGEILALQWNDIDFKNSTVNISKQVNRIRGELVVTEPKTKASIRKVLLSEDIMNVLKIKKKNSNSKWLFPSPVKEDSPLDPSSCGRRLQKIMEKAGVKKIRFHDL